MRWRELLTGALVTLVVTIIAGLIVYYVTVKRPSQGERLVFQEQSAFSFSSQKAQESFGVVKVKNLGGETAHNVRVAISYGSNVRILDHTLAFSSGNANGLASDDSSQERVSLILNSLMPGEAVTISVMLSGSMVPHATIAVRSDGSIGEAGEVDVPNVDHPLRSAFLANLIPVLGFLQGLILFGMRRPIARFIRRSIGSGRSLNNTAFLYLHSGLERDAERMLRRAIVEQGADALMLANYGLALGMFGRADEGLKHLAAAEFYTDQRHERAVAAFNRALIYFTEGREKEGDTEIRRAVSLSGEIKRYIRYSQLVKSLLPSSPLLAAFVASIR